MLTPLADQNYKVVGTGDYDGDGKSDILWRNSSTGASTIWKSGNSATQQAVTTLADLNYSVVDGFGTGDLLTGGTGNNTLYGTINADVIFGNTGNDTLSGGLGADQFRFTTSAQGNDSITDFAAGIDKIQVTSAGFASLAAGTLNANNFVSGAAPSATQAVPQFLYNTATGQLSFDADGTGGTAAVNLVTLIGHPAITAGDLVVV